MSFPILKSILRLGFFRFSGLLLYLLVQYLLLGLLSARDYSSFVAFNSVSMLLGQVSTAGIDGKLVSNLCLANGLRCTPIVLKSLFEYVPFSLLAVILFILASNASLLGSGMMAPTSMEIVCVVSVCFLQPLLSILLVLADKSSRLGISDVINVAPWLLRAGFLLVFPFWWVADRVPTVSLLDLVFLGYIASSVLVLCFVFGWCRARLFDVFAAFLSQALLLLRSPRGFGRLFASNSIYLLIGFCASAPALLSPMILRGSEVTAAHLQAFSVAFVMLGVVQSCGSQYLLRTSVRKIVLYGRRSSLFLALRRSFFSVWPLFLLYGLLVILLAAIAFAPSPLRFDFLDVDAIRLLLLMSFGLFPSAILSLWHALFNIRRFLAFNVASRFVALIASVSTIVWLTGLYGAVGASIGLAVSPLVAMLSFCLVVLCSPVYGFRAMISKFIG